MFGWITHRQLLTSSQEVNKNMAELNATVEELKAAVSGVADRVNALVAPLTDALANVKTELATERERAAAVAASEDAEDVEQNARLADTQAYLDGKIAEAQTAAANIEAAVRALNDVAVGEVPAEEPAPAEPEAPVEEPAAPVEETPAPVEESPAAPEAPVDDTDNGAAPVERV